MTWFKCIVSRLHTDKSEYFAISWGGGGKLGGGISNQTNINKYLTVGTNPYVNHIFHVTQCLMMCSEIFLNQTYVDYTSCYSVSQTGKAVHLKFYFLTHPCRRQPLCIKMVYNICWRSFLRGHNPVTITFWGFWLVINLRWPSDVRDLRVKVVVEIETP